MTIRDPETTRAERQIRLASELKQCDGLGLKQLVYAALTWLNTNHASINALNVFPVPDGDTGTNMLLTMQAAWREIADSNEASVSKVAHAVAHGALMGARGNSGVILSQIWRGFSRGLGQAEVFDSPALAAAMEEASNTAYRGVVKPVEGTILTVIKDVAGLLSRLQAGNPGPSDLREILEQAVDAAYESVDRTPDLLPVLKSAGVVDSGGKGLAVLLEGMLRYLRGQPLDASEAPAPAALDLTAVGAAMDAVEPGQEWEVVLDFRPRNVVHLPTLYDRLESIGTSIQVGEGDGIYRIHVHLLKSKRHEPIEMAEELGTVVNVHMENLLDQLEQVHPGTAEPELKLTDVTPGQIGVVAVSPGIGCSQLMGSMGAAAIVSGGQSMNPSTQDMLEAIGNVPTDRIIVLPNNKNIFMAAQQAAEMSVKQVQVVPTRSVPQGIAAMLAFVPDGDIDTVAAAMERSMASVHTGEVTTATRDAEFDGITVAEGQIIGLHNGTLKAAGQSAAEVVMQLLEHMQAGGLELITIYYGSDVSQAEADALAQAIRSAYPNLEDVQAHSGGQPLYHYILSAE
jgi:uncharacterized protein